MTKGRVTSSNGNTTKNGVTIRFVEQMSDQGAIAEIGVLGNKSLAQNTGIEMPVCNAMRREVIVPETANMSNGHSREGWDIDRRGRAIAAYVVQEREEIAPSSVVSKGWKRLMKSLDRVKISA